MTTVVLLPGLACDGEVWTGVLRALDAPGRPARRGLPCVVSDVHFHAPTVPAMAALLLAGHAGPLVLVGHSMGGMVALEALRQAPDRVVAAALLGSTARPDTPELVVLRTEACALFEQGRAEEVLRANVAFAFDPSNVGERAADPGLVARYFALVLRAGAAQLVAQNRAVMTRADQRPHLGAIRCPLLVACGRADLLTPPECSEEIATAVPGAELHLLDGCGHMLILERPDAVGALLAAWLGNLRVS
jgi:pimeloyl-ACP methyl ester carboxylesterase